VSTDRRAQLLDAIVETAAAGGLGQRSLRDLAAEVGTSHRMLLHHFGSREELLVAVVREVEARQAALVSGQPSDPAAALEESWDRLSDPALWPFERLFFECYSRGVQGEVPFDALVPAAVHEWLDVVAEHDPTVDPDLTRLALAVVRGLLLDLVATGDRVPVDRAMACFTGLLERRPGNGSRG
jgi:AcrR family transcriptional regulator